MQKKRHALENPAGRDIDDLAVLVFAHLSDGRPTTKPGAANIDRMHQIPFVHGDFIKAFAFNSRENSRVIDHDIEFTEGLDSLGDHFKGSSLFADIGRDINRFATGGPDLFDHSRTAIAIRDHDLSAFCGQSPCVSCAQTLSSTGHNGDTSLYSTHHKLHSLYLFGGSVDGESLGFNSPSADHLLL